MKHYSEWAKKVGVVYDVISNSPEVSIEGAFISQGSSNAHIVVVAHGTVVREITHHSFLDVLGRNRTETQTQMEYTKTSLI